VSGLLAIGGVLVGLAPAAQASPAVAPSAPTNVNAQSGYDANEVTWTVGANGGSTITGFLITVFHAGSSVASGTVPAGAVGSALDPTPGATDTFNLVGQTAGVPATYAVAGVNSVGPGTSSSQTNAGTPTGTPTVPYAPTMVSGSSTSNFTETLHWTVPPNNGDPITAFTLTGGGGGVAYGQTIAAGAVGTALDPTPGAADSFTLTGLPPTTYAFVVTAHNAIGDSALLNGTGVVTVGGPQLATTTSEEDFGAVNVGDYIGPQELTLTNTGTVTDTIRDLRLSGPGANDYFGTVCTTILPGAQCTIQTNFQPGALGERDATLTVEDGSLTAVQVQLTGTGAEGYYEFGSHGQVGAFGDASYYGDAFGTHLNQPVVSMSTTGDDGGYWLVAADGGIFAFGEAQFYGSTGALHLNQPIVGMVATPDAGGYWLVATDGGIFAFGDAQFYGSTGAIHLNKPIVGMAVTPDGGGYWLVASDGGIFAFGDAQFYGSTGAIQLNQPIVGMAATPDGRGYWMVATDGGIFAFGDARFFGSTGAIHLNDPIVGMSPTPDGSGYWMDASDGGVFTFGDAPYEGSVESLGVSDAIGITSAGPPTLQAIFDLPATRSGTGGTSWARPHAVHQASTPPRPNSASWGQGTS
jgi:hypothetical protein